MSSSITQRVKRLSQDRGGVSAIEFAIIASILVTLVLGAYDLGNAAQQQIQLQEAVRSGGGYAIYRPTDVTGIQKAVANALPSGWTLINPGGVAAVLCSCMSPNSLSPPTSGSLCTVAYLDSCSSGKTPAKAITITATMTYKALTPLFAALLPNNTATYVTRFQ